MPREGIALLALLMLVPTTARADCAYDIGQLGPRVGHIENRPLRRQLTAQLAQAQDAQRTSESECRDIVTRIWRQLRAAAEATGSNTQARQ